MDLVEVEGLAMTMIDDRERIARLEERRENDDEWRREMLSWMERLESRMDRLESKVDSNQRWTIGLLVIILIAIIGSNWIG